MVFFIHYQVRFYQTNRLTLLPWGTAMYVEMSDYKRFTARDFALDEHFQQWVLKPDQDKEHFWNSLMTDFPDKRKDIEEAIELVKLTGLSANKEANDAYLQVWQQIRQRTNTKQTETPSRQRHISPYAYWAAAAVIGILAVSYFLLPIGTASTLEYRTAYGEMRGLILEDGSRVTLNSNSVLTVSGNMSDDDNREVTLQGEAFFKVVKTSNHQTFTVKTPTGVTVQVLGTEFNVNTRREQLAVYLQSGKVRLQHGAQEVILNPGERADYKKSSPTIIVSKELPDAASENLAWKTGYYIMNDQDLQSVVQYIEDNFGTQVLLADSTMNSKRITARVHAHDLPLLLKIISETLELSVEQKGNQIIMRPSNDDRR
jgi:transmembrane sensor